MSGIQIHQHITGFGQLTKNINMILHGLLLQKVSGMDIIRL